MADTKYGVRIKAFEAKSIYEKNLGIYNRYTIIESSIKNSLFLDFMKQHGLKIEGAGTKDIVCLNFEQDSRSYEKEREHWKFLVENGYSKRNPTKTYDNETIEYFKDRLANVENKKDLFAPKTKEEIRTLFYQDGVEISYPKYNKQGEMVEQKIIKYVYLFRSTGMAKGGKAYFIREDLHDVADEFLNMGIKLPQGEAKIVEISAYKALVASAIIDRVKIDPQDILVLNDVESKFITNAILVGTHENKETYVERVDDYELKNTIFDGQGLIESSLVPKFHGFVLLRQHFCKMACFKTHIQKYFKDYYGDDYETATIKDMWGNPHLVKNIKLITTDNAMKYVKFNVTYEQWCEKVKACNNNFGIVKDAHPSKMGDVQKMSYQMVNCLDMGIMDGVVSKSLEYVNLLKGDDNEFLKYLEMTQNYSNDHEVLLAIVKANPEFVRSEYFRDRKKNIIQTYTSTIKKGKLVQNADNLVIVGNPYGMLMHAVGLDPAQDPTFEHEDGCIQVWTSRFDDGDYLAEFRNPFNSANNLGYCHNHYHEYFDKYFDFSPNIISVNMIETDFQDRNNGLT